ncbi:dynactin subunit 5 [Xylona heveae TC161]|uniref:Dynactin subunit 5 n=1 Tax=Xylona heveae (strain CBS 132557 / TC161) TaxID=1328760 RepID=A0A164ZWP0_XYLHT|nr:dynactin subunit 5 [Xylona heveae TC161]KZF19628.1 dynactin subunit 5 [Xylona heveae TC161]
MPPKAPKSEYIETDTGNKVSRRSIILGTPHIILGGRTAIQTEACLRGDLHRLSSPSTSTSTSAPGGTSVIAPSALIRPPSRLHRGTYTYVAQKIGDHVLVGERAVVEAASIGNHVVIGAGAVLGKFCIIKDGVKVLDGAVLPAGMVVPSGSVVGGRPARIVGEVGEGWGMLPGSEGADLRERIRAIA